MNAKHDGIELPYAVFVRSQHGDSVSWRGVQLPNLRKRYFETHDEALLFAGGNKSLVMYRPGEAWARRKID